MSEAQGSSVVHEGRSCPKRKRAKAQTGLDAVEKRDGEDVESGLVQLVKEENVPASGTVHRLHGHGHTHGYEGPNQSHSMRHRRMKRW